VTFLPEVSSCGPSMHIKLLKIPVAKLAWFLRNNHQYQNPVLSHLPCTCSLL